MTKIMKINKVWLNFLVKHRRLMFNLANAIIPNFPYGEGSCTFDSNNKDTCWWIWACKDWAIYMSWHSDAKLLFITFKDCHTGEHMPFDFKVDLLEENI